MEYNLEQGKKLIEELIDLWFECSIRCERIENLIKQIYEKTNNSIKDVS